MGRVELGADAGAALDMSVALDGVAFEELAADRVTIRLPATRITRDRTTVAATIGAITVRAVVPGAQWLTPPRAYQP